MLQELEILHLMSEDRYVSTNELMKQIPNSEKTLRGRVKALDELIRRHGAHIESKRGYGYLLVIEDREEFIRYRRELQQKSEEMIPGTGNERITYILSFLLNRKGYMKREELAEFLCVSEKTISADMRQVEFILKQYELEIERRPARGMRVAGDEFRKRQCILNQLILMNSSDFFRGEAEEKKLGILSGIVKAMAEQHHMNIPEVPFQNLVYYLSVTVHRMKHGFVIRGEECAGWKKDVGIYKVSEELLDQIRETGMITDYLDGEVYYTSLFLWGSRIVENNPRDVANFVIPGRVEKLAGIMISSVYDSFGIDFRGDLNLRMCLINHLASLDVRMRNGIYIENPHLEEIREKYFMAYVIAKEAADEVARFYGKPVSEDEIGYFALLFAMKLKQETGEESRMNILLFCATGKIGSQFLKFRLEEEFSDYINRIDMCGNYDLDTIDFSRYDYVFATIPIDRQIPVPILMIRDFFNSAERIRIYQELNRRKKSGNMRNFYREGLFFTGVPGKTKEEVISWMCGRIAEREEVPDCLEEVILERERLGSTDFGNLAAMPHPSRIIMEENLVCVGILKEPILWERNKVQLVVLAVVSHSASEEVQEFFSATARLLLDQEAVKRVIEGGNYETLMEELTLQRARTSLEQTAWDLSGREGEPHENHHR